MTGEFNGGIEDDFDLQIREEAGQTCVTVVLPAPAERCYSLFNDADQLTDWLAVVGTMVVRKRDDKRRALEIDFMGSLRRASVAYTLAYEYDDAEMEVRWKHKSGSLSKLEGSARFVPESERTCRLEYRLASELPKNLPPWADDLYQARPAETVVLDFCEWLEGQVSDD